MFLSRPNPKYFKCELSLTKRSFKVIFGMHIRGDTINVYDSITIYFGKIKKQEMTVFWRKPYIEVISADRWLFL